MIHGAVEVADQVHASCVVTANVALPPSEVIETVDGDTLIRHCAPPSVRLIVWSLTVIVPARVVVAVLGCTENENVAEPCPVADACN